MAKKMVNNMVKVTDQIDRVNATNGKFARYSYFNGRSYGLGSKADIEQKFNRLQATLAMYHGEAFVCPSFTRSDRVNVYGVSGIVPSFDEKGLEKTIEAMKEYKDTK